MVSARRLPLPVALPLALALVAPAAAPAAERTAQFAGRALLDGDTLVFEDRTFPRTENTGRQDSVIATLQPDGRFHIDGGRAEPFLSTGQYTAGPGCDVTTSDGGAFWTCDSAGITRFEVRNPFNAGLITALTLGTAFLPLPVTASLGPSDDTYTPRPDLLDNVDGGEGRDKLDTDGRNILISQNPPRFVAFRYSDDGVANDGWVGHGTNDNLRGFEVVSGQPFADDELSGAGQADEFRGFDGNDHLVGNGGDDKLIGGTGADRIEGGAGDDTLEGLEGVFPTGFDAQTAAGDTDTLDGGPGNDLVVGNEGVDDVTGGAGDDTLMLRDGTADKIRCEQGTDTYDLDLKDSVPTVAACVSQQTAPGTVVGAAITKLTTALRANDLAALNMITVPLAPVLTAGAVREKPNVVVARKALVARGGRVALTLSCPRATTTGCRGTTELLDLRRRRIAAGPSHAVAAGRRATVTVALPGAKRGVRPVVVRVIERGKLGRKTTEVVLPLAVT